MNTNLRMPRILLLALFLSAAGGALADIVYDNSSLRSSTTRFRFEGRELGEEIVLAGNGTYTITNFQYEYYGFGPDFDNGNARVRVKFYRNDGVSGRPGTLLYNSGFGPIPATGPAGNVLEYAELSVPVPKNFTWTVEYDGLSSESDVGLQSAGLDLYQFPTIGLTYDDYWERSANGLAWILRGPRAGQPPINFGCRVAGVLIGPPTVTVQPQPVAACPGSSALFEVVAIGTAPLSYQWYKGPNPILGAIFSTLTVVNVGPGDVADYSVIVSNGAGSATSHTAHLALQSAGSLTILTQPQSAVVCRGDGVVLSVVTAETLGVTFQWYHESDPVPSATASTLVIPMVDVGDVGDYTVVVSSCLGSVNSQTVSVNVFDPDQESPCLHIKKGATPETAVVYWTSFFGYDWTLQETPDLNPPGPPFAWVDSVYFPDYFDGIFSVIVPDTDPSRFFRLTKQP